MPVSFDPREPFFRISTPDGYSKELADTYGMYKTVGWADDTWALDDGAIDEAVFLQDSDRTLDFREKELLGEMDKRQDLLIAVFYQTDTVQHLFYRYMDPQNPEYGNISDEDRAKYGDQVLRTYQQMDDIVGKVMDKADDNTTVIVMSDHGFNPFRNAVNLNTWLVENGYMKKRPGADTHVYQLNNLFGEKGLFWNDVLMNESEAYSLGLGNIYINLKGRESQGVVDPADYEKVRSGIIGKLLNLRDQGGNKVVAKAQRREELYWGPYANNSADIIVSFNPGYRVSWQTSLGGVPPEMVEPNMKKWSGDHCTLDPAQTEGVFFINRVMKIEGEPSLMDVNPTLRDLLGLEQNSSLDGHSMFESNATATLVKNQSAAENKFNRTGYNVLFITLDCTRADYISVYNNASLANTSSIDALASESTVFENAFTAFTFTCPSHTVMMTGRYFGDGTRKSSSLPASLEAAGYRTGASIGFGVLKGKTCQVSSMFPDYDTSALSAKSGQRGGISANYTINWISEHKDEKFFFWLHLFDAHPPGLGVSRNDSINYAKGVEYVDEQVGRVIEALKSNGLENKTIVVVVADHGMGDNFRSIADNRELYDEALHVPLIIHVPGVQAGEAETLASTVDLAPTLAELLGIPYYETQGESLLPAMLDGNNTVRNEVFASYAFSPGTQDMARTWDWKLIRTVPRKGAAGYELFNLSADQQERTNLYGNNSAEALEMGKLLETYDRMKNGSADEAPEANPAWYANTSGLDNQTLDDLRSFGYIN
ncbi:MAG: alkaline phosphatase family protein, partial [Candidatus ainarchaeum sp.]|nr:alkaline phosphatase family protein [Candidatus ainarchaeum sp.]